MWDRTHYSPTVYSSSCRLNSSTSRSFSRSKLHETQTFDQRLQLDADDSARLIKHLSPNAPAAVIGNSSKAIVSLKLLVSYPQLIYTLASYEPSLPSVLPDFESLWPRQEALYDTYRRCGISPAGREFAKLTKSGPSQILKVPVTRGKPTMSVLANTRYWFESELLNYPLAPFDVTKDFLLWKERLVMMNGEKTNRETYQWRTNELIAEKLDLELEIFPGEHLGHITDARLFAERFVEVISSKAVVNSVGEEFPR